MQYKRSALIRTNRRDEEIREPEKVETEKQIQAIEKVVKKGRLHNL